MCMCAHTCAFILGLGSEWLHAHLTDEEPEAGNEKGDVADSSENSQLSNYLVESSSTLFLHNI